MRKNLTENFTYLFFLISIVFAGIIPPALAVPQKSFVEYEDLKKKDPEVKNLIAWEKLATQISKNINEKNKLQSYQTLAELFEKIYYKREFRPALSKAVYYYELLVRNFSGKAAAPKALLRLGDLRRNSLKDEVAAKSAYYEIIDVYPQSPQLAEAKKRLGIEDVVKKDKVPAEIKEEEKKEVEVVEKEEKPRAVYAKPKKDLIVNPLIVIDPGHGGTEEGAVGVEGVLEKEVVLNISLMLEELLQERLHARTVLTRKTDQNLSLADRTKIANDHQADLFISIHANASEYKNLKGIETYYLDNTADKSSLKLAERENASLGKSVDDLSFIMSDFIQGIKLDDSISLAHALQNGLHSGLSRYYKEVKDLGVKKAPFYVLVGAHMPCALVEVSFIDNPEEGKQLISKRYQRLAALGIFQGLQNYFESRIKSKE